MMMRNEIFDVRTVEAVQQFDLIFLRVRLWQVKPVETIFALERDVGIVVRDVDTFVPFSGYGQFFRE